jgi:hypothetical protein
MTDVTRGYRVGQLTATVAVVPVVLLVVAALPPAVSVLAVLAATAALGVATWRLGNYLLVTLSVAMVARLCVLLVDSAVGLLPTPSVSTERNAEAIQVVTSWLSGEFPLLAAVTSRDLMIAHLLAPFYIVVGQSTLAGKLGVAFFSVVCGYLLFRLARQFTTRRVAVLATAATLLWPTILVRSVLLQREILILGVSLLFLVAIFELFEQVTLPWVAAIAVATYGTFLLRRENLLVFAAVVGVAGVVANRDRPALLGAVVSLSVGFAAFFLTNLQRFIGVSGTLSPETVDTYAHERAKGGAAYLVDLHYNTWFDIVLYLPIKVLYFLYTPFPWQIGSPVEVIVGATALGLLTVTVAAKWGIARLRERPVVVGTLFAYLFGGVLAYSVIEMNYGAAVRRRIQFVPVLLVFGVVGLSEVDVEFRLPER